MPNIPPPPSCEEHYRRLQAECAGVMAASFEADVNRLQAVSHNFVAELAEWLRVLASRPEAELFKAALREYQYSLLAVVQGQYRQAFMALRLSFELLLAAVHFSANELNLRMWSLGRKDIVWSAITSNDTGVLSKQFVSAFFEELADSAPTYLAMADKVYRECSEYVHGNAHTHEDLSDSIQFSLATFEKWHDKAKSIRVISSFALCARYVQFMDEPERNSLEQLLLGNLGHIPAVRQMFGAPVEQPDA
jgi:hypothetical protein